MAGEERRTRMSRIPLFDRAGLQSYIAACDHLQEENRTSLQAGDDDTAAALESKFEWILKHIAQGAKNHSIRNQIIKPMSLVNKINIHDINISFLYDIQDSDLRALDADNSPQGLARKRVGANIKRSIYYIEYCGMRELARFLRKSIPNTHSYENIIYNPPAEFSGVWNFDTPACGDSLR